jgi:hypothetical protein
LRSPRHLAPRSGRPWASHLAENFGWEFIFYVNVEPGAGLYTEQIGEVLAWTGFPQLLLILVPQLMKRLDPRIVIGAGFALFAAWNFMNIHMTSAYAADQLFCRTSSGLRPGPLFRAALGGRHRRLCIDVGFGRRSAPGSPFPHR